ncbi:hypothetical protein [Acinetobacter bereziniae]|uniref:hypothetical protein n=1 Tax=Acinetobacter bereziniae TaxID=106648 RepID=UPI001250BBE9|nr:hypothetical protein [Acinetobacter bereziniae]
MTIYRDDIQETIVHSNSTKGKSKTTTDEIVRIQEDALYRLSVLSGDVVSLTDEFVDSFIFPLKDQINVVDQFTGRKRHIDFLYEQIGVTEQLKTRLRAKSLIQDEINSESTQQNLQRLNTFDYFSTIELFKTIKFSAFNIKDQLKARDQFKNIAHFKQKIAESLITQDLYSSLKLRAKTYEQIVYKDIFDTKKIARSFINEAIKVKDGGITRYCDFINDQIQLSEKYLSRLRVFEKVIETVEINKTIQQKRKSKQWVTESLTLNELSQNKALAKQWLNDLIFVEDETLKDKQFSHAWTANVDSWAMSRYQDYGFSELVVLDGVLFGVGEDGIYRLDAIAQVDAQMVTGQLDLGQGQLTHPLGAYIEYELSGSSRKFEVGVSTTQSGTKQTYFYLLPTEKADYLTNGRVLFGRGLRGRHFSFDIRISGEHCHINDLSIDLAATKRRV